MNRPFSFFAADPKFVIFAVMNRNLIERYIWIVDILSRYKKLTRAQINGLWLKSRLSDGNPLPERTFYHYRRAIEEIFNLEISCNSRGEYFISENPGAPNRRMTNWLLDSYAVNNAFSDSSALAGRVEVEDVPSAREFLPTILEAMSQNLMIEFSYAGFKRSRTEKNIVFSPYFMKRYKQRWYMLGKKEGTSGEKTYALDRIKSVVILDRHYQMPENMDSDDVFGSIIGITSSKADTRTVRLRTSRTQAKYFRALPFHHTQVEELTGDDYSIFTFRLKLNYELVHEIMALGDNVKVLEPKELRLMVVDGLKKALAQYES